jgi:hypothetical protein
VRALTLGAKSRRPCKRQETARAPSTERQRFGRRDRSVAVRALPSPIAISFWLASSLATGEPGRLLKPRRRPCASALLCALGAPPRHRRTAAAAAALGRSRAPLRRLADRLIALIRSTVGCCTCVGRGAGPHARYTLWTARAASVRVSRWRFADEALRVSKWRFACSCAEPL